MATVTAHVQATPAEVFEILADGWYYPTWVVGTSHVRAVGADWPAAGSRIFHASGVWPIVVRDETKVEHSVPAERLVMITRARPMGEAKVDIILLPEPDGTSVTMVETPVGGPGRWLHNPLNEALLIRRNVETLARLTALAEHRSTPST
ncbi:MAG: SRPBCC family protein [Actinomycetota bacterium]|nr:SRPBCC family protein [Actinomycetota bacterium]